VELDEAMRTQHACRYYRDDPVPDEVLLKAVEVARFAPNGGNRCPVRFVFVRDPALRGQLGEWYLPLWEEVAAAARAGAEAISAAGGRRKSTRTGFRDQARTMADTDQFARRFGEHPVIIVVCADLAQTHPTDTDLGRLSIVGGASVYPMAQNLCLALRDQGVATTFTTLLVAREPAVKQLLGIPDHLSTACHIVAGYPARPFPRRLHRPEVGQLAFADRYGSQFRPCLQPRIDVHLGAGRGVDPPGERRRGTVETHRDHCQVPGLDTAVGVVLDSWREARRRTEDAHGGDVVEHQVAAVDVARPGGEPDVHHPPARLYQRQRR